MTRARASLKLFIIALWIGINDFRHFRDEEKDGDFVLDSKM